MKLPYAVACLLVRAAEEEAAERVGVPMSISVVDAEGIPLVFGRMDGALHASIELAFCKAYTAAVLRMPTHELGELARPGGMLYGIQHTHEGRIVVFGGGFPLRLEGSVAGAVGISGGSVEEDIRVARPVVELLEQMEKGSRCLEGIGAEGLLLEGWRSGVERALPEVLARMTGEIPPEFRRVLLGALYLAAAAGR